MSSAFSFSPPPVPLPRALPILKAIVFLSFLSCSLVGNSAEAPLQLRFFIVSEEAGALLRFFDNPEFPRLGYIAAEPDLVITELEAVSAEPGGGEWSVFDREGNVSERGKNDPSLQITFTPYDGKALETLTSAHRHQQMLVMLGSDPLMAPVILTSIRDKVQVTLRKGADADELKRRLETLVRKAH
jgi:hypothetical protein